MVKFSDNFVSFLLLGLLVVGTISFIVSLQENNDVADTIRNDSIINRTYVDLSEELDDSSSTANSSKASFEADVPERGFGSLIVFAIVGVTQTFTSIIIGIYQVLWILPTAKLGIPRMVANVLSTILFTLLVLQAWRVYRAGD